MSTFSNSHVKLGTDMAHTLTHDGVVHLGAVLAPRQIDRVGTWLSTRDAMSEEALEGLQPEYDRAADGRKRLRKVRRLFWNDPDFWTDIFLESRIGGIAESLVGPHAAIVFHAAFMKPAEFGSPTALHQDQALWDIDYPGALTIWTALTASDARNGCLVGYPGSQRRGAIEHRFVAGYERHASIPADTFAGVQPSAYHLRPGEAVAWHRFFAHASAPNQSSRDRKGVVAVFVDASAPDFRAKEVATLESMRARVGARGAGPDRFQP